MAEKEETLLVLTFDSKEQARDALATFKRLAAEEVLKLDDAVFIDKDAHGKASVTETVDVAGKESALHGGLWGALIGAVVAGPVGAGVGVAISAGLGALTAKLIDIGIPDQKVKALEEALAPNSSMLALLLSKLQEERLEAELTKLPGAKLMESTLSEQAVERLQAALGPGQSE